VSQAQDVGALTFPENFAERSPSEKYGPQRGLIVKKQMREHLLTSGKISQTLPSLKSDG